MTLIKDWVQSYHPKTGTDLYNAKREIIQEIILAGLNRGGFFKHAAFYGGTALRIFYGLDRFSEDLDFSLLYKDPKFTIKSFLDTLIEEFNLIGLKVRTSIKSKKKNSAIESTFLKDDSEWSFIHIEDLETDRLFPTVKIKIEIDRNPPLGFLTEAKLLVRPYSFYVNILKREYLFAGKMHALLFRQWKQNVKGRDWYDLQWYITRGIELNMEHFRIRAAESGHWQSDKPMNKNDLFQIYQEKVNRLELEMAKKDVLRFVGDKSKIEIWSKAYFLDLFTHLKIQEN